MEIPKQKFLDWMKARELQDYTILQYERYLNILGELKFPFDQDDIDIFLAVNKNNVARAFVKTFIEFLSIRRRDLKIDDESIRKLKDIDIVRVKRRFKKPKMVLSHRELKDLFNSTTTKPYISLIKLSYFCGLRISELLNIRLADINFNQWEKSDGEIPPKLIIRKAKGNKKRFRNFPNDLMCDLFEFYYPLFLYKDRNDKLLTISRWTWAKILNKLGERINLQHRLNHHVLRRTIATHLLESGIDIRWVQQFLGHEDISTTQIYIQSTDKIVEQKVEKFIEDNFNLE